MGYFIAQTLKTWPKKEEDGIKMYEALDTFLKKGRKKNTRRFSGAIVVERGKTLEQRDCIVVWLWKTPIMSFRPDGEFTLHSGGHRTVSTKLVMESFLPKDWRLSQEKGIWYVGHHVRPKLIQTSDSMKWENTHIPFYDGISLPSEFTHGRKANKELARIKQTKAQIKNFVKKLEKMLDNGTLEDPGPGDCFLCQSKEPSDSNTGHIFSHLKEKYVVPSLVWNALVERFGETVGGNYWIGYKRQEELDHSTRMFSEVWRPGILKAVTAYLKKYTAIAR
jgi:hypothetical protein